MAVFTSLPTPEQVWPVTPKGKHQKLMQRVARAMLFPDNQPGWRIAGMQERGFNVRLYGIVPIEDIRLIEPALMVSGWYLREIKHRAGNTYLVLVDAATMGKREGEL